VRPGRAEGDPIGLRALEVPVRGGSQVMPMPPCNWIVSSAAATARSLQNPWATAVATGTFASWAAAVLSLRIDIARWYRDDGPWQPEQIADFYADLALRMVGAERN